MRLHHKIRIMGILNVTPDSFSDGGVFLALDKAVEHAKIMVEDGADIIDLGAESTRPGSTPLDENEEWQRLKGILPILTKELRIPLSLDTYKASIAEKAIGYGVKIINDIWGGLQDPDIFRVVAGTDVTYVLMHNSTLSPLSGQDVILEVRQQLEDRVEAALQAGLKREQIILDPGIGFGKTVGQNLEIVNRLDEIKFDSFPVLIGPSRKSFIGQVLSLPVHDRLEGTAAIVSIAVMKGAEVVRVHDVKEMTRVVRMAEAVLAEATVH